MGAKGKNEEKARAAVSTPAKMETSIRYDLKAGAKVMVPYSKPTNSETTTTNREKSQLGAKRMKAKDMGMRTRAERMRLVRLDML